MTSSKFGTRTGEESCGKGTLGFVNDELGQLFRWLVAGNQWESVELVFNSFSHLLLDFFITVGNGGDSGTRVGIDQILQFTSDLVSDGDVDTLTRDDLWNWT
ncbi:hypothetical protein WICPIJ_007623 [Wickerhamomyces pijperi]|uniref:Uncharacterized protein n=1 Tax=Wickerhamomyces pijperi TaxID=599730 RepID=A0A9P8PZE5_WICPI|nr:hypothetical protein WICPIJ_007623 [Wickerhamomyces pijperi]